MGIQGTNQHIFLWHPKPEFKKKKFPKSQILKNRYAQENDA